MRRIPRDARSAAMVCAVLCTAAAGQTRFEVLTDFPDTNYQGAFALSGDGSSVVGFARRDSGTGPDAVRWNDDGSFDQFGPGNAWSVSFDGGTVATDGDNSMWRHRDGQSTRLDTPDGHPRWGQPRAMSSDGEVISGYFRNQSWEEAFVWTEDTGLLGLGLGDGLRDTRAFGMSSDASTIVGEAYLGSGAYFGFRWTQASGYELLRNNQSEHDMSIAFDTSAEGGFLVGRATNGRAAYWTEATGTVPLPALQRLSQGYAFAVTPDASAVVGVDIDGADEIAFLWTPQDGIRPLADVLLQDHGLDTSGFILERATGISDDGLAICGIGRYEGTSLERAWRVTIPAPPTASALAALAMISRRRR